MFISYDFSENFYYQDDKYYWEYELTDSEFGTVSGIGVSDIYDMEDSGKPTYEFDMFEVAVIQEYSKRNLNVAANLAVAFVWSGFPIDELIEINKEYNPLFLPYEKDLQKYLVLL
jgi:hypothetical protein